MKNEKYIYLIFSRTNNKMSKFIRTMTNYDYNHVSVALDRGLDPMYSFARRHKDTPFYGGFVKESPSRYISGDAAAHVRICAIPVSRIKFRIAQNYINKIARNGDKYLYNTISAMTNPLHRRVKIDRAFTCVEFVVTLLKRIGAPLSNLIPRFCSIQQLDNIYKEVCIYEGEIQSTQATAAHIDDYLSHNSMHYRIRKTVTSNARLFGRLFRKLWHKISP